MSASLVCPACGALLSPQFRFCNRCGQPIPQAVAAPAPAAVPLFAAPPGSGSLPQGTIIQGRYLVDRTLGQGGMGAVYLVRDAHLSGRPCAMKELLDYSRSEQEREAAIRRFLAEAETLAALDAPGIPQVYDRFVEGGRYYLVMEFVAGVDLGHIAAAHGGPLPEQDVARWALQVCDVLTHLHEYDPPVVHRDLKPANLLVTRGGRIKLVDFGIARAASASHGTVLGTQGYSPPEQYRGEMEPRSDLYALGASLHHLLSGRDPQQQAPFDFPPLTELIPGINREMAGLVARLLSARSQDRPASAQVVAGELMQIFPGLDPYHPRDPDPQVDALVLQLLEQRLGSGALRARSGHIGPPGPAPVAAPGPAHVAVPGPAPVAAPGPGSGPTAPLVAPQPAPGAAAFLPGPVGGATAPLPALHPIHCPVCGNAAAAGRKFCMACGVRISGPLPQLRVHGASADLALRVPPGYWERSRVQRVTFVDDTGLPVSGVIISILPGAGAEYAFVARGQPGTPDASPPVGAPVQVYVHERQGEEPVLTAIGPEARDRVAEAVRLWQRWLVP